MTSPIQHWSNYSNFIILNWAAPTARGNSSYTLPGLVRLHRFEAGDVGLRTLLGLGSDRTLSLQNAFDS